MLSFLPDWPLAFTAQTTFGLLLIAGVIGGYLVHRISWLPSVTGFMLVGLLIGPSGLGIVSNSALGLARSVIEIALGLILFRLGLTLDLRSMGKEPALLVTALAESLATFGAVVLVLTGLGMDRLLAGLAAAIVVSSSPAILIHVAHEVGAAGPVTERAKKMVALNNVFSFLAFSALLPAGHLANEADWSTAMLQPVYQLLGSALLAVIIGLLLYRLTRLTRHTRQYRLALIIGAIMLGLGLADALNLSELFVPLVLGVVIRTREGTERISDIEFGEAFELFFIVLFVYAGAKINLGDLSDTAWLAVALVITRCAAKWLTVYGLLAWAGHSRATASANGMLLIPMAGLAIGLANTADKLFALQATQLNALILASVAMLETLGPPLAAYAFRQAGEASSNR